mmetsp:Transcript_7325/g.24932  ORF Transcript_7325/g.24932 Transcript_7325/m.24932 type:complete len:231 (+) Transcript_7325:1112-1804(+)
MHHRPLAQGQRDLPQPLRVLHPLQNLVHCGCGLRSLVPGAPPAAAHRSLLQWHLPQRRGGRQGQHGGSESRRPHQRAQAGLALPGGAHHLPLPDEHGAGAVREAKERRACEPEPGQRRPGRRSRQPTCRGAAHSRRRLSRGCGPSSPGPGCWNRRREFGARYQAVRPAAPAASRRWSPGRPISAAQIFREHADGVCRRLVTVPVCQGPRGRPGRPARGCHRRPPGARNVI